MLDPRCYRQDLDATEAALARRGYTLDRERLTDLETRRKALQIEENWNVLLVQMVFQLIKNRGFSCSSLPTQHNDVFLVLSP